jgi:hypothetical protein
LGGKMKIDACFFCGNVISGKVSREHIFGDSFLGYLDLKRANLTSSQTHATSYSKVKVPSHRNCNNREGSWFESYVLSIVRTMDRNLDHLADLHTSTGEPINEGLRQAFTQWLAKLYFGLIYWEVGLKKHADPARQRWLVEILEGYEFDYLRRCYTQNLGFKLPSSLFHFRVPDAPEPGFRFDFGTGLPHGLVYIRFRNHLLVTALGDGNLVREWFQDEHVELCQAHLLAQSAADPVAYLHAVAHIWAVREWLPIQPRLELDNDGINDQTREGLELRPAIDDVAVNARAKEIFDEHASKWKNAAQQALAADAPRAARV